MVDFIKRNAGHILGFVLAVVAVIVFHSWLTEHDARLVADGQVKAAQAQIDTLRQQQANVTKAAKLQVTVLQKAAAAVKTAPEAIAALPSVSTVQLEPEALPDAPDRTSVLAVPLYQDLNVCKQTGVNLDACVKNMELQIAITAQKDLEITALKKKPGFWHRVKTTATTLGIGAGIGAIGYAVVTR